MTEAIVNRKVGVYSRTQRLLKLPQRLVPETTLSESPETPEHTSVPQGRSASSAGVPCLMILTELDMQHSQATLKDDNLLILQQPLLFRSSAIARLSIQTKSPYG